METNLSNNWILVFPFMLALGHYVGFHLQIKSKTVRYIFRSLSAGFSVAYVFIVLMPEILERNSNNFSTMAIMLFGFTTFHLVLKYSSLFYESKKERAFVLTHAVAIGLYNLVIAYSLVKLMQNNFAEGVLVFIVVWLHILFSDVVGEATHSRKYNPKFVSIYKTILTLAPVIGGIMATSTILSNYEGLFFLAFSAGAVIYVSFREEIPSDKYGRPLFFLLGVVLLYIIAFASN